MATSNREALLVGESIERHLWFAFAYSKRHVYVNWIHPHKTGSGRETSPFTAVYGGLRARSSGFSKFDQLLVQSISGGGFFLLPKGLVPPNAPSLRTQDDTSHSSKWLEETKST